MSFYYEENHRSRDVNIIISILEFFKDLLGTYLSTGDMYLSMSVVYYTVIKVTVS